MSNLELPYIHMPKEFTRLLRRRGLGNDSFEEIISSIVKNSALTYQLENVFSEFDGQKRLIQVVKTLGWKHFRDRICSFYISKTLHGRYPSNTNMDLVKDLQSFEELFAPYSVHSNSRGFLLAFYLKLSELSMRRDKNQLGHNLMQNFKHVASLLKSRTSKNINIDWLILISWHLMDFFGVEELKNILGKGAKYQELYEIIDDNFRKTMIKNLLAYGASIEENEVFLFERI